MSRELNLQENIEGMEELNFQIKALFQDEKFSFNLIYFLFNSIKTKRIYFSENNIPYAASTVFSKTANQNENIIIKIDTLSDEESIQINLWCKNKNLIENLLEQKKQELNLFNLALDENNRKIVYKYTEVIKLLDSSLFEIINKSNIRSFYFPIANCREILYKIFETEKFDPILLSMGKFLEQLKKYEEIDKLGEDESNKMSLTILKWKKDITDKILKILKE